MASSIIKDFDDAQKFPMRGFTTDNEIKLCEGLLTYTQLQAANSSPIDLIAAPGANKVIVPVSFALIAFDYNGTAYTGDDSKIIWATSGNSIFETFPKADFEGVADFAKFYNFKTTTVWDISAEINNKVQFKGASDFANNGSSVRYSFLYRIISIS